MIDYTQPPLAYLVRIPQADQDSLLHGNGIRLAEEAARFLSFERIGAIVSSDAPAAVETAEIIFSVCCPTAERANAPEVDDRLAETIRNYAFSLREAPWVIVCTDELIRDVANVCSGAPAGELVAPGGIVSIHGYAGEGACAPKVVAIARHMILDFEFADVVAMVADGHKDRSSREELASGPGQRTSS